MEHQEFDRIARGLTRSGSRRETLRALAGAALGLPGLIAARPATAAARCPRGKERCGDRCHKRCPDIKTRDRKTCRCECPEDMRDCGKVCVGADRCCPGQKDCGGGCIHEDACCPYTHRECLDGSCIAKADGVCCPGDDACPADPEGCCNATAGEECSADGCCNTLLGMTICNGRCVDTSEDPNNCGGCGVRCRAGCQTCANGTCQTVGTCCPQGSLDCGGRCVSPKSDPRNCGGCGVTCGACHTCHNGTCTRLCAAGWHCCGAFSCCQDSSAGVSADGDEDAAERRPRRRLR